MEGIDLADVFEVVGALDAMEWDSGGRCPWCRRDTRAWHKSTCRRELVRPALERLKQVRKDAEHGKDEQESSTCMDVPTDARGDQ